MDVSTASDCVILDQSISTIVLDETVVGNEAEDARSGEEDGELEEDVSFYRFFKP